MRKEQGLALWTDAEKHAGYITWKGQSLKYYLLCKKNRNKKTYMYICINFCRKRKKLEMNELQGGREKGYKRHSHTLHIPFRVSLTFGRKLMFYIFKKNQIKMEKN